MWLGIHQPERWLRQTIGEQNYRALDPNNAGQQISAHSMEGKDMRQLMKKFEDLKKGFPRDESDRRPLKLDLPGRLSGLTIPRRISQGELYILVQRPVSLMEDRLANRKQSRDARILRSMCR